MEKIAMRWRMVTRNFSGSKHSSSLSKPPCFDGLIFESQVDPNKVQLEDFVDRDLLDLTTGMPQKEKKIVNFGPSSVYVLWGCKKHV
ncbi:hypothetical protein L1987_02513 [Smallanthus sonchifolius]|uniref:Uncharacterized protein n=1 Tax=Smallanthus sonchifolius TaxID=185202 RepID=A0ACB9K809_9ASTR|nr:hypothetical protein L1987_02513 [Smallanthus sonchifolius]